MKPSKQERNCIMLALNNHYTCTQLTAERLAEHIGISVRHLNNLCHAYFGKTPSKLIQWYRIQKALEFYSTIGKEHFVCSMVGFDNSRTFKAALKEYQRNHSQQTNL